MTPAALVPAAGFALLIGFSLYRRSRRLFGRQPVQPARMKFRIVFLVFVAVLLMLRGFASPNIALALAAGLVCGAALALLGLHLTRFETTPQGRFYTPHGGIGIALTLLLLGRLVYRFVGLYLYPEMQIAHSLGADTFSGFQHSPLTAAIFTLLIGYYVAYSIGILIRSNKDPGTPPPAA
jgi:drug/metabolite transporter superfamily protein YnfA